MRKYLFLLLFILLFIVGWSSTSEAAAGEETTTTTNEEVVTDEGEEVVEEEALDEEIVPQFWTKDAGTFGAYGGGFKNGTELNDFISLKSWDLVRATGDCDDQCSVNFRVIQPKTGNVDRDTVSVKCTVRFEQSDILVRKGTCDVSFTVKSEQWLNVVYSYWMLNNSNEGANRMYETTLRAIRR